jgi:MerR family transcriptional regulator/heat shock protein HspR
VNSSRVGEIYSVPDGIYVISVAARILEMHPQTLRKYERAGLVRPSRTIGMLRLYSEEDIVRLRLIKHLVSDLGLNIAGVELSLRMFNELLKMRSGLDQAEASELKTYLDNCLQEMFNILKAK